MSTVTQIRWFSKYNDVVKELHELRKENDKLQALADNPLQQLRQRSTIVMWLN